MQIRREPQFGAAFAADIVASMLADHSLTDATLAPALMETITKSLQRKWRLMPERQAAAVSALLRAGGRKMAQPEEVMTAAETGQNPAVPVEHSIGFDFLICLEDGKELKMLKRHIREHYGLTPDAYRKKWGLPSDYPMVAPAYTVQAVFRADNG